MLLFIPLDFAKDILEFRSSSKYDKKELRYLKFAKEVLIWSQRSYKHEICRSSNLYYIMLEAVGKLKRELERLISMAAYSVGGTKWLLFCA